MNNITYRGLNIKHISKASLKNSYITISPEADIVLKTPKVSKSFIYSLIDDREKWIRKKLLEIELNPPKKVNFEDEVLLFGDIYSIDSIEATKLREKLEKIKVNSIDKSIKCYNMFYKDYCLKHITPRVEYFSQLMGLKYESIKFRKMKSRWGSCSSKRILTFNTELIKTKKELIDYVVVHELAHLKHMNHSMEFHSLVERYLPDSRRYRKELKKTKISTF